MLGTGLTSGVVQEFQQRLLGVEAIFGLVVGHGLGVVEHSRRDLFSVVSWHVVHEDGVGTGQGEEVPG